MANSNNANAVSSSRVHQELNVNENDPFFYSTVPMFRENLGVDNDETLGDTYFDNIGIIFPDYFYH
jgi:hypothetical protein